MGFLRPVLWLSMFCGKGFLFVVRVCFVAFFGLGEYFLGFFLGVFAVTLWLLLGRAPQA